MTGEDPIAPVAAELAREASLLCFDEFAVRDIADAMILGRLFTALFAAGVVVVATSNVAPDDLYKDGLNRALFLPFVALLRERLEIVELDARTDYRLEKLVRAPVYYTPLSPKAATAALDAAFLALTGCRAASRPRSNCSAACLHVPQAVGGVARFSFDDLCRRPLGSADYLELAERFQTLFVDHIPVLTPAERNEAKRFIILDRRALRHAGQAGRVGGGRAGGARSSERTARRRSSSPAPPRGSFEMRSADYLALPHGREGVALGRSRRHRGDLSGRPRTTKRASSRSPARMCSNSAVRARPWRQPGARQARAHADRRPPR